MMAPPVVGAGFTMHLGLAALARIGHIPRRWRPLLNQMHLCGIKSLHVVLFVNLFIGMILALQLGFELARYGQQESVGLAVSVAMVREMAPMMTAVVLAASVASAMAAELGTMHVQEEVTALEVMSVDIYSYLVAPRVLALTLIAPMLTTLSAIVGILGGGVIAYSQLGLDFHGYLRTSLDALADTSFFGVPRSIYTGLIKAMIFGFTISVIGCSNGLRATHGASGVGNSTRAAVRNSIIMIIVLNFFLGKIIYQ
jgi:phospholipid/cholesterol/gamma-HCH transport system permease protein